MCRLLLVFVILGMSSTWCLVIPDNPCPNIFAYKYQNGLYFGEITVPYNSRRTLDLTVNISMLGVYENMNLHLELLTPADSILTAPQIRYRVNFPLQNVLPKITQIAFNGRVLCYGPSEPLGARGVTNIWSQLIYKIKEYTFVPTPTSIISATPPTTPSQRVDTTCGKANDIQNLIVKGDDTNDNEFPWLVAMFRRQGVTYDFQCTANLITSRHVVTAAHCVWFYKAPLIDKEDILLVLGRSNISYWASTGALIRTAYDVIPHPNYKQDTGHCDIAIIKLNEEVTLKSTLRPICLWPDSNTNLKNLVGTVAGWGKSRVGGNTVTKPKKVVMPVVSQEACLRSHIGFKNITSQNTFCAGNRDGSGPCTGDSGAGFAVKMNGRWFLRGLVSTAIKNEDFSCDLNEYIVFADLAKVKNWINSIIKNH